MAVKEGIHIKAIGGEQLQHGTRTRNKFLTLFMHITAAIGQDCNLCLAGIAGGRNTHREVDKILLLADPRSGIALITIQAHAVGADALAHMHNEYHAFIAFQRGQ